METLADKKEEKIRMMAIAHRASKMEQKDFMNFIGTKPPSHEEIYKKHQEGTL